MNSIESLIEDFKESVKGVVNLFYDKYDRKDLLNAWHEGLYPQIGTFGVIMKKYFFHGIGLCVELKDKIVDFDFGEDDRIDGFDAWRLWGFTESQIKYKGLWTKQHIEKELKRLEQAGKIYRLKDDNNYYWH
jgi:hypothetical protein